MGANNIYYPSVQRASTFETDNYILIDDKKTGIPLKISLEQFFSIASSLGLFSINITGLPLVYEQTVNLTANIGFNIPIITSASIVNVSVYYGGQDISDGVSINITPTTVTLESNINLLGCVVKIIYSGS
jgi:hypothetical protein